MIKTNSPKRLVSGWRASKKLSIILALGFLLFSTDIRGRFLWADSSDTKAALLSSLKSSEHKFKILHIMSYHSPWEWTDDLLKGFTDQLNGLEIEVRTHQMDTKRNSSEEWKQKAAKESKDLIESWKPDLVYTTDDNVQKYVAAGYVNSKTPFVFSGVNAPPETYGFVGSTNITGILEHEHFVETVKLLRKIVPKARKIAVIVDDDPTWTGVMERMKRQAPEELKDVDFVAWDVIHSFDEYKDKIRRYQTTVDALGLLGIHTFKDGNGANVPWQEVVKWTTKNSNLPDFTFWKDRIPYGSLCAVYVSGYEQGCAAGKIAREILAEGKSPSTFPMQPTRKGEPVVNLARARMLGIDVTSEVLLTAKIIKDLE
jgi:ABC-type uncharacterized transport system substrate-binding protein